MILISVLPFLLVLVANISAQPSKEDESSQDSSSIFLGEEEIEAAIATGGFGQVGSSHLNKAYTTPQDAINAALEQALDDAIVVTHQGHRVAGSFSVTRQEIQDILKVFEDENFSNGVTLANKKYTISSHTKNLIQGKHDSEYIFIRQTSTHIIIGLASNRISLQKSSQIFYNLVGALITKHGI